MDAFFRKSNRITCNCRIRERAASTWRRISMRWWRRRRGMRGSWRTLLKSSAGFVKAQRPFNALSQVGTNKRVLNFDKKLQDLIYCFHIHRLWSVVLLWISLKVAQTRECLHATHHEVRHSEFYISPHSLFFEQSWCKINEEWESVNSMSGSWPVFCDRMRST